MNSWRRKQIGYPAGAANHSEYVAGQVPAGGPVSTSASAEVLSETASRGVIPGSDTVTRDEPITTGRRPSCEMRLAASASRAVDFAPGTIHAAGWPQRPRTTGANASASCSSTKRTLADGPMAAHSDQAAATEPP